MVKIDGNYIWRDGMKIGFVDDHHIRAHDDHRLGYFENNFIYGERGHKLAYLEGDSLISYESGKKIPLEKISESIQGVLPEIGKCAVYVLLGA